MGVYVSYTYRRQNTKHGRLKADRRAPPEAGVGSGRQIEGGNPVSRDGGVFLSILPASMRAADITVPAMRL